MKTKSLSKLIGTSESMTVEWKKKEWMPRLKNKFLLEQIGSGAGRIGG